MKLILCFFVVFIFTNSIQSQNWIQQNSGSTANLMDVCFINDNTGIVCGVIGTILRTTNAGINWISINSSVNNTLAQIYFTDQNTGYIAGHNGNILRSIDGGITWNNTFLDTNILLYDVYFININTGFTVGDDKVFKTSNAGATWDSLRIEDNQPRKITFHENKGYITTFNPNYDLLITTNNGNNWIGSYNLLQSGGIDGIDFQNNTGFIAGYTTDIRIVSHPAIFKTTNNGINWSQRDFLNRHGYLGSIKMYSEQIIYCTGSYYQDSLFGDKGIILTSINSGLTWNEQQWNGGYLRGISFTANKCYLVGANGTVLVSNIPIGIQQISNEVPNNISLYQNYPNPFNPTTNITFAITNREIVKLSIFDVLGRKILTLLNQELQAGIYKVDWNAPNYPSGIYYYSLETRGYFKTKKMMLIK